MNATPQKRKGLAIALALLAIGLALWKTQEIWWDDGGDAERIATGNIGLFGAEIDKTPGKFRANERPSDTNRSTMRKQIDRERLELSPEQIEAYLTSENRSPESLLTAYYQSSLDHYLKEAMEKDPENPRILLASLQGNTDPAETLKTLETLKRVDPENALGNLLSAKALLDQGDIAAALQEMELGQLKSIELYHDNQWQNNEEAFLSASFNSLESKFGASRSLTASALMRLSTLSTDLMKAAASMEQDDPEMLDRIYQAQRALGLQVQTPEFLLAQIVGYKINSDSFRNQQTPDADAKIAENKKHIKNLGTRANQIGKLMSHESIPDSEWIEYYDRMKQAGEFSANEWMLSKHPPD